MLNSSPSEERFPLLLLFLEDGQRSSKSRRILIDKNRYQGIASGATAVITQWPGHLTACWLTAIVIGLGIILVSMMTIAVSLRPGTYMLTARCKRNHIYDKQNETATIHLVHGPNPWFQKQLDTLEQIAQNYHKSNIEVIVIQSEINYMDNNINNEKTNMQVVNFNINDSEANSPKTSAEINNRENMITVTEFQQKGSRGQTNSHLQSSTKTSPLKSLKRVKRIKRFSKHKSVTPGRKKLVHPWEDFQLNINIGTKKLLKMLLNQRDIRHPFFFNDPFSKDKLETQPTTTTPKILNIQDLLKLYSNIRIKNSTYEEIFKQSPLYLTWHNMNQVTRLFAIRVLEMWNYAGITFEMPATLKFSSITKLLSNDLDKHETATTENIFSIQQLVGNNFIKYKKLISVGISAFENLPEGLVTVDDEGFHMETKTVCHAYFGEILINLKMATMETMPKDIIKRTLRTFCKRGAVDGKYCKTIMR